MRSKTVRLGFKRRRFSSAPERECIGDNRRRGVRGKKGRLGCDEGGTVGLYSFTLPAIVSASSVVSPKLPLPAPSSVLYPEFGPLPRRLLARRRLSLSLYMFYVHPYQSRVATVSSVPPSISLFFLSPSLSFCLCSFFPADFIYPVRVAWTLLAFKYQNVSVAYGAPLMSPPCLVVQLRLDEGEAAGFILPTF